MLFVAFLIAAPPTFFSGDDRPLDTGEAAQFVALAAQQLPGDRVDAPSLRVYTTVDVRLQAAMSDALQAGVRAVNARLRAKRAYPLSACAVAIDAATRFVRAAACDDSKLGPRLIERFEMDVAETIQPMIYAAAIEDGRLAESFICLDEPVVFEDPVSHTYWKPPDAARYEGNVSLVRGFSESKWSCAARVATLVGSAPLARMTSAVGLAELDDESLASLARGSSTTKLLGLVNAYATLAAGGLFAAPIMVRKINDEVVTAAPPARAMREKTAERINRLLAVPAMKTSTGMFRTAVVAGHTSGLALGVWVGFPDHAYMELENGRTAALPIWTAIAKAAEQR